MHVHAGDMHFVWARLGLGPGPGLAHARYSFPAWVFYKSLGAQAGELEIYSPIRLCL